MDASSTSRPSGVGDDRAQATVVLRRRAGLRAAANPLTSRQLGSQCGAAPNDLHAVRAAASAAGIGIVEEHAASRRVRISGPAAAIASWLDAPPAALAGVVTAVLGGRSTAAAPRFEIAHADPAAVSYTPIDVADVYRMPDSDGAGQTIAIIELGGGFTTSDLDTYFSHLGLSAPSVRAESVDGAQNAPGSDPSGADGEVLLDIEIAGALAPAAAIIVYFAPNTDAGFLDAISTAAHADPAPTAISISWGQSEDAWTAPARTAMDDAFADAAAMGVTVTAAAGDNGSHDNGSRPGAHADFPASSPHILGCGGTTLHATDGVISSETVWNDGGRGGATGGGVSDVFALPAFQTDAGVPTRSGGGGGGRGVPDVAGNADPQTGYQVLVDGQRTVIGGTSAVAPLWAGLIARIAALTATRPGLAVTALYASVTAGNPAPHLRDISTGSNGAYRARIGWDACTGLGVPDADTLAAFAPAAGSPAG